MQSRNWIYIFSAAKYVLYGKAIGRCLLLLLFFRGCMDIVLLFIFIYFFRVFNKSRCNCNVFNYVLVGRIIKERRKEGTKIKKTFWQTAKKWKIKNLYLTAIKQCLYTSSRSIQERENANEKLLQFKRLYLNRNVNPTSTTLTNQWDNNNIISSVISSQHSDDIFRLIFYVFYNWKNVKSKKKLYKHKMFS